MSCFLLGIGKGNVGKKCFWLVMINRILYFFGNFFGILLVNGLFYVGFVLMVYFLLVFIVLDNILFVVRILVLVNSFLCVRFVFFVDRFFLLFILLYL